MPAWNEVQREIEERIKEFPQEGPGGSLNAVRYKHLNSIHQHTGCNLLVYYSGFLSKPTILDTELNHEDLNGFMMTVHKIDRNLGLDLLLHTPGGSVAAALSIVNYLRKMFGKNIRAIVPQIAMSAGTMIACSCKEIVLAKHSQLGPTDPHMNGIPAAGVKKEFQRACKEVSKNPQRIPIWQMIIGQYRPTFLSQCENAVQLSKEFVKKQLETVMLESDPNKKSKAARIVRQLNDYSGNKSHGRPIHIDECKAMGLMVRELESDPILQDRVLTVHHCYMHIFMNTPAFKIIENHTGNATLIKQQVA